MTALAREREMIRANIFYCRSTNYSEDTDTTKLLVVSTTNLHYTYILYRAVMEEDEEVFHPELLAILLQIMVT